MSAVRDAGTGASAGGVPEGRYGRSSDERGDRRLKAVGAVLGVLFLAVVGWIGYDYIGAKAAFSGELITSDVVSAEKAEAHLEIRKDAAVTGVCTVRALAESGAEVGRKDFTFDQREAVIKADVSLRTTQRATAVELVGCDRH
ncbi:DUF4307 domain-containing protein [Streptomyces sp. NPDC002851]